MLRFAGQRDGHDLDRLVVVQRLHDKADAAPRRRSDGVRRRRARVRVGQSDLLRRRACASRRRASAMVEAMRSCQSGLARERRWRRSVGWQAKQQSPAHSIPSSSVPGCGPDEAPQPAHRARRAGIAIIARAGNHRNRHHARQAPPVLPLVELGDIVRAHQPDEAVAAGSAGAACEACRRCSGCPARASKSR